MAYSLNKVMLIGNLGRDAEHKFTPSNLSVTTFSIATSRSYKGKDGNWVNETTWINVVSYNTPDYLKDALRRGKKFYVEGRLSIREYTDKDGIKKYYTEVVADKLIPLEAKEQGSEGGYSSSSSTADSFHDNAAASSTYDSSGDGDLPF